MSFMWTAKTKGSKLVDAGLYSRSESQASAGKSLSFAGKRTANPWTSEEIMAQVKASSYHKGRIRRLLNDPDISDLVAETIITMIVGGLVPQNRELPKEIPIREGFNDDEILKWSRKELIRKISDEIVNNFEPTPPTTQADEDNLKAVINAIREGALDVEILAAIKNPESGMPKLTGALKNNLIELLGVESAQTVAQRVADTFGQPELLPTMHFLDKTTQDALGSTKHNLQASSDYLNFGNDRYMGCTPDELLEKKVTLELKNNSQLADASEFFKPKKGDPSKLKLKKGHAHLEASHHDARSLVYDTPFPIEVDGKEVQVSINKKELMRQMKLSMLVGDHDVNPGNMFFVYDKLTGECRMGRIDFGHALNDLVKDILDEHAPKIDEGRGRVLDAINRLKVNSLGNVPTKFRKSYKDIVLDPEFANVLREGIDTEALTNNLKKVEQILLNILKNEEVDAHIKEELREALKTACKRMGKPLDSGEISDEALINAVVVLHVTNFIMENQKDAEKVADLIEMQALIEQVALGKATVADADKRIAELQSGNPEFNGKIEWVRRDGEKKIFIGTLDEYMASVMVRHPEKEAQGRLTELRLKLKQEQEVSVDSVGLGNHVIEEEYYAPNKPQKQEPVVKATPRPPSTPHPSKGQKPEDAEKPYTPSKHQHGDQLHAAKATPRPPAGPPPVSRRDVVQDKDIEKKPMGRHSAEVLSKRKSASADLQPPSPQR